MSAIAKASLPQMTLGNLSPLAERFVVRAATWDLYDLLSEATGECRGLRFAFDGEDLEIMTVGPLHDWLAETFRTLKRLETWVQDVLNPRSFDLNDGNETA